MELTSFDILVLLIVGVLAVLGALRGFVTEILTLLAWVAAVIALKLFYPAGKAMAATMFGSEAGASILAFVIIFGGVFFLFRLVGRALGDRTKKSIIGPIDRVMGFGFGGVKGLIVVSLMFLVVAKGHTLLWGGDEKLPEWLTAAKTEPLLDVTARAIIDYAGDRMEEPGQAAPSEATSGQGYSDDQRDALETLLDDTGGTEI